MAQPLRILFTGGGSGGHIYPLMAVADALKKITAENNIALSLYYMGPRDEYASLLSERGISAQFIPSGKLRRYISIQNLIDIPRFFLGIIVAWFKIFWLMPDVIFSKGGTGALPVVFAGWFYRIPIVIHESDATPGLTNLLSSPFAQRVGLGFEQASKYFNPKKIFNSGNPVRNELIAVPISQSDAKIELGFKNDQPLILIIGGSQGSQRINEFVVVNLPEILKEGQILHQTGKANYEEIKKLSQTALVNLPVHAELESRYRAVPYFEGGMKSALSAADLVIARAGAATIAEIAAFQKPSILIPLLEAANDHQRINAFEFARGGGAIVIEENNLLPGIFLNQVKTILHNPDLAGKMGVAAKAFYRPNSAQILAEEVLGTIIGVHP